MRSPRGGGSSALPAAPWRCRSWPAGGGALAGALGAGGRHRPLLSDQRLPAARADKTEFGAFTYRGGLELQSDYRGFGGLSSLRMDAGGTAPHRHFRPGPVAHRDAGHGGHPPLRPVAGAHGGDPRARRAAARRDRQLGFGGLWIEGGTAYVSVERTHRIFRFDTFGREGVLARGVPQPVPMGSERLAGNRGIEALGILPALPARRHALRHLGARAERGRRHPRLPDRHGALARVLRQAHQ